MMISLLMQKTYLVQNIHQVIQITLHLDLFPKIDWKYFRTILRLVTILKYLHVFIYRNLTLTIAYKF